VEGVGAVPPHGMPRTRDDHHLDVLVAELGQPFSRPGTDEDLVILVAGDHQGWPHDGCRIVDPRSLPKDLFHIS